MNSKAVDTIRLFTPNDACNVSVYSNSLRIPSRAYNITLVVADTLTLAFVQMNARMGDKRQVYMILVGKLRKRDQ